MMTESIPDDLLEVSEFVRDLRALEAPAVRAAAPLQLVSATVSSTRSAHVRRLWIGGALAAGLAAMVGVRAWNPRSPSSLRPDSLAARGAARPMQGTTPSAATGGELAQWLSPFPTAAYAQTGMPAAYAAASGINTQRLVTGRREYVRLSANDYHDFIPDSRTETSLEKTTHNGRGAWRLVTTMQTARTQRSYKLPSGFQAIVDTTWLDARTLRPMERRLHASIMHVHEVFSASEGVMTFQLLIPKEMQEPKRDPRLDAPHTWKFTLDSTRPLVASEDGLRLLLRTLPLSDGWKGSIAVPVDQGSVVSGTGGKPRTINLRVAGTDTVQLYSGRYPTWRVLIELGDKPAIWSVSKETGETLITNGSNGLAYPESKTYLMYGLEETKQAPSVRRR